MYLENKGFASSNHNFPLFVIGTRKLSYIFSQRGRGQKQK